MEQDSPQVRVPPPMLLLFSLAAGFGLQWWRPLAFLHPAWRVPLAVVFGLAALLTGGSSVFLFRKAGTHLEPWKPSSKLVLSGPYRFSRNPIYLSFFLVLIAAGCGWNNLWMLFLILPLAFALRRLVIAKEEKYLEGRFGQAYLDYKKSVRRWI